MTISNQKQFKDIKKLLKTHNSTSHLSKIKEINDLYLIIRSLISTHHPVYTNVTCVPNDFHNNINKKLLSVTKITPKNFLTTTGALLNKNIKFYQKLLTSIIDSRLSLINPRLMSNKTLNNLLKKASLEFKRIIQTFKVISIVVTRRHQEIRFYLNLDLNENPSAQLISLPTKSNINYHYLLYPTLLFLILISLFIPPKKLTPDLKKYFSYSTIKTPINPSTSSTDLRLDPDFKITFDFLLKEETITYHQ